MKRRSFLAILAATPLVNLAKLTPKEAKLRNAKRPKIVRTSFGEFEAEEIRIRTDEKQRMDCNGYPCGFAVYPSTVTAICASRVPEGSIACFGNMKFMVTSCLPGGPQHFGRWLITGREVT